MAKPSPRSNATAVVIPVILALLGALSLYVCNTQIRRSVQLRTLAALQNSAFEQSVAVVAAINGQFSALSASAFLLNVDDADGLSDTLSALQRALRCEQLAYAGADGLARTADGARVRVGTEEFYLRAMAGERVVENGAQHLSSEPAFLLCVPVLRDGQAAGALIAAYPATFLSSLLSGRVFDQAGAAFLTDGDGALLFGDAGSLLPDGGLLSLFSGTEAESFVRADLLAQQAGTAVFTLDGREGCAAYQPLGADGWFLVCLAPPAAMAALASGSLSLGYAILSIVLTGALLLLFYLLYSHRRSLTLATHARQKEIATLATRAQTDALTGLLNRATAESSIRSLLSSEDAAGRHALLILDLDNFKGINDTFGHQCGDALLTELSQQLRARFRAGDIVGRLGGDEFIVLLKDVASPVAALTIGSAACAALGRVYGAPDRPVPVSCCIGVAFCDRPEKTFDELYREADLALYRAKQDGKSHCVLYDESMARPEVPDALKGAD